MAPICVALVPAGPSRARAWSATYGRIAACRPDNDAEVLLLLLYLHA